MTDPKWLTEPDRPTELAWFFDAPWMVANRRDSHEITRASAGSPHSARARFQLAKADRDALRRVIYGNWLENPGEMTGLTTTYNTIDPKLAQNAVNVLDAGGLLNLTSIWLLGWGPRTIYMASPDGQPPGIGGECCIVVADWRYAARIANIDAAAGDVDLFLLMSRATNRIPRAARDDNCRAIFYMNNAMAERLKGQLERDTDRIAETQEAVDICQFRRIPIRVIEELRNDETRVE